MNHTHLYSYDLWGANSLPVILQDAVEEVQRNTGAPYYLILNAALAVVSAAAQGKFNVARPGGLVCAISLFLMVIAASGEGKSAIIELLTKAIRDFEREQCAFAKAEEPAYLASLERWEAEMRLLRRTLENDVKKGVQNHEKTEKELARLLGDKPVKPSSRKMIYEDATSAALKAGLAECPYACVFSDEGTKVMNGAIFEDPGLLNSIWSGSDLVVDRKNSDSFHISNPRLTMAIMVQPLVFKNFQNNERGAQFRDLGMFARFLVAEPVSTQGTRFRDGSEPSWQKLEVFHDRIRELLKISTSARLDAGESHAFTTIKMSSEAAKIWLDEVNRVESLMAPGQILFTVRDFAAKIGEQIARIAALFHLLNGDGDSEITGEEMRQAINLMGFYGNEFLRIFGPKPEPIELLQFVKDAAVLNEWLHSKLWNKGFLWVYKNQLRQYCPNALRGRGRFEEALQHLAHTGCINIYEGQQSMGKRPKWVVSQALALNQYNWAQAAFMRSHIY